MRFRISMQHADGVSQSIDSECERFMAVMQDELTEHTIHADEWDEIESQHRAVVERHVNAWLRYGEHITLEFDTDMGTCSVVRP